MWVFIGEGGLITTTEFFANKENVLDGWMIEWWIYFFSLDVAGIFKSNIGTKDSQVTFPVYQTQHPKVYPPLIK